MAKNVMAGGTYGEEKKLQEQISQGGINITPAEETQTQQFVAPPLQATDAFNPVTKYPSEPTLTGADKMGLVQVSGKEALRAAYNAYPSEAILQLYNSLDK